MHVSFKDGLRAILHAEERAKERITSWAPAQTAESDASLTAGLALVDVALGRPSVPVLPDWNRVGGRPIYRPLVGYALVRAGMRDELLLRDAAARASADSAVGMWWALVGAAAGETGGTAFRALIDRQRANGEFFDPSTYRSPDLHWYDELVALHAAATFAAMRGDELVRAAVQRAALFHTAETQPDHATSQPWAIHAFAVAEETMPLAELLLHGAMAQNAGRLDVASRILVADAVLSMG